MNKGTHSKHKILVGMLLSCLLCIPTACTSNPAPASSAGSAPSKPAVSIDCILDWTPNTNHTGLFVAQELGYFTEEGLQVNIKQPPEDSTSDLILNNKAPFGISFQDSMAAKLAKGAPLVAVAALVEHNTSGILVSAQAGIESPKDLQGKRYGTWSDPIELAMIQTLVREQAGPDAKVELVPNTDSNSIVAMQNGLFDAAWIYYGWDGLMAKAQHFDTHFFLLRDYNPRFDFYSPVLISNPTYLREHPEEARAFLHAVKRGYQYAIQNPDEAAKILIHFAPELETQKEFVLESQRWLSKAYASDPNHWGEFDPDRWNGFYQWLNEQHITEPALPMDVGFSNEWIQESPHAGS